MGKKSKNNSNLGRSLIKDRFSGKNKKLVADKSMLHTTELQDGYDWGRLNIQSVTEESSFQEFLATAELAGTEFQAEKLNIKFVNPRSNAGLLTDAEKKKAKDKHEKLKQLIQIPRRPPWTSEMSAEELQQAEREHFLEWRRALAQLQEKEDILLTPFEKNLEFWRQLWRVIEKSDVIVQIVDARNPLLFRCEDLEKYVKEVSEEKMNLILINKADFLTEEQREHWAKYFESIGTRVAFFSAIDTAKHVNDSEILEEKIVEEIEEKEVEEKDEEEEELDKEEANNVKVLRREIEKLDVAVEETAKRLSQITDNIENILRGNFNKELKSNASLLSPTSKDSSTSVSNISSFEVVDNSQNMANKNSKIDKSPPLIKEQDSSASLSNISSFEVVDNSQNIANENHKLDTSPPPIEEQDLPNTSSNKEIWQNSSKILTREALIDFFRTLHKGKKVTPGLTTIGMVGYPNVGKSSTINTLMTVKKVSVSATPGKTKHFQTLYLDKDILLCDCPGLVMPSFMYTKAEMIINGILPIDQMRDHVPPINLICSLIPRHVLEDKYGLMLPKPMEGEDPDRCPFAEELLNAYGYNRGFMTANGQPDNPRAARYILKDFVSGKLLYVHAPLNIAQEDYHTWPERRKPASSNRIVPPRQARAIRPNRVTSEDIDQSFFHSKSQGVHVKGKITPNLLNAIIQSDDGSSMGSMQSLAVEKPWKKINKHQNKRKREKLRRVYAHLDEH